MATEQRKYPRFITRINSPVKIKPSLFKGVDDSFRLVDISVGGMKLVSSQTALRPNKKYTIELNVCGTTIKVQAICVAVITKSQEGVFSAIETFSENVSDDDIYQCFEFISLGSDVSNLLGSYVKMLSGSDEIDLAL